MKKIFIIIAMLNALNLYSLVVDNQTGIQVEMHIDKTHFDLAPQNQITTLQGQYEAINVFPNAYFGICKPLNDFQYCAFYSNVKKVTITNTGTGAYRVDQNGQKIFIPMLQFTVE